MTIDVRRTAPPLQQARHAVIGLAAVIVSAAIPPFLVGALAPRIARDFPFDSGDVGLAMAGFYLVSGVLSPGGGRVVERLGTEASLRCACGFSTLGLVLIAVAGGSGQVVAVLTLLGIPNALCQPSCNDLLARLQQPKVRALSFGVVQAAIPSATLVAGVLLAVASYGGGWRWTVVAVAAMTLLAQLLVPRLPTTPATARSTVASPTVASAGVPSLRSAGGWLLGTLVATGFFASAAATALPSFTATSGAHAGLAPATVAVTQTLGSICCALVRIGAPTLASHTSLRRRLAMVAALQFLGFLGFAGLASGTSFGFVLGGIAAFAFGWGWNGLFNLIVASTHPDRIAAATGLSQAGVFLGGMSGPLLFAGIAERSDFGLAWGGMAGLMCAAMLATLLAGHVRRLPTAPGSDSKSVTCTPGAPHPDRDQP